MRTTHTYAILQLSDSAYHEIREKLKEAGYQHAFHEDDIIDMHGLAIQPTQVKRDAPNVAVDPVVPQHTFNMGAFMASGVSRFSAYHNREVLVLYVYSDRDNSTIEGLFSWGAEQVTVTPPGLAPFYLETSKILNVELLEKPTRVSVICAECAEKYGGTWPEGHQATMNWMVCDMCLMPKSCCDLHDWSGVKLPSGECSSVAKREF